MLAIVSAVYQIEFAAQRSCENMQTCIFNPHRTDLPFWDEKSLFSYISVADDKPSNVTGKIMFTGDAVVPASLPTLNKANQNEILEALRDEEGYGEEIKLHTCG